MTDYVVPREQRLGKGTYGNVYASNHPNYVSKVFDYLKDGIHELAFLHRLNYHPANGNHLQLHSIIYRKNGEVWIEDPSGKKTALDEELPEDGMVINMCKYDCTLNLFNHQLQLKVHKWPLKMILFELFKSYDNLYQNFIVHGDVKLDNVLVRKRRGYLGMRNFEVVLCDFSLSFFQMGDMKGQFQSRDLQYIQTINYRAPELILGGSEDNEVHLNYKIDIWSMGIIIYKLLTGNDYFRGRNVQAQVNHMCRFFGHAAVSKYCSEKGLKVKLPEKNYRCQKSNIIRDLTSKNDPDLVDLLDRMLELDDNSRISLKGIFEHRYFSESSLIYPYRERDSRLHLDEYFRWNPVSPNYRETGFDRIEWFIRINSFVLSMQYPVTYVFKTIYLFDHFVSNDVDGMHDQYDHRLIFLAILKILGDYRFGTDDLLALVVHADGMNAKKLRATFIEVYDLLLLQLKRHVGMPCYLDYLSTDACANFKLNRSENAWWILVLIMADIRHYGIGDKSDITDFLMDVENQRLELSKNKNHARLLDMLDVQQNLHHCCDLMENRITTYLKELPYRVKGETL